MGFRRAQLCGPAVGVAEGSRLRGRTAAHLCGGGRVRRTPPAHVSVDVLGLVFACGFMHINLEVTAR